MSGGGSTRAWQAVGSADRIVGESSPSAQSPQRKGRKVPLSDVNSWPGTMYDQLHASRGQHTRRFPVLAPTRPSTPQSELWSTQRYDTVAPPRNKPILEWLAGAFSTCPAPFSRPEEEKEAPFARLLTIPACLLQAQEDVTVMRQSQAEAWRVLGYRFRSAHGSRSFHHRTRFEQVRPLFPPTHEPLRADRGVAIKKGRPGPLFLFHHWCAGG